MNTTLTTPSQALAADQRVMHHRRFRGLRVAQDLHDGPLQEIIGLSFQVQELENSIEGAGNNDQLHAIRLSLQELAHSMRSICGELRPPTLVPFGLEKTILSHVETFQSAHPELSFDLDLAHDGQAIPEPIRIVLFRIYQEALNNILRHAQAQTVRVFFGFSETQAVLEVQDDGVGFDPPKRWVKLARQGHLGLVGAIERAKDVGGKLEVAAAPGQGTLIRAVVPLIENLDLIQTIEDESKR